MYWFLKQTRTLILKDLLLEWRHLYAFSGIILYLVSTVFVSYLSFEGIIDVKTWNALFWIILLFASVNAILKGFVQETESRMFYYYTIMGARVVIAAKIIYHAFFMIILSLAGIVIFTAFLGNPVQHSGLFLLNMLLGVTGFSCIMTLVSAIVSRVRNNFTLMGILSFPLILPLLLVVMKVSYAALLPGNPAVQAGNILVLILLTFITFILSVLLYPFIWTE